MRFMNDYDLTQARMNFGRGDTPNRLALVMVVDNLRDWTDNYSRSDGWHSWPKPCRSADKAIALIESRTYYENEDRQHNDITDAEMRAAVAPIKAFLTREKVSPDHRERILRAVSV
jgi:hypothetical protein